MKLSVILLLAGLGRAATGQQGEFAAGRASYDQGEFKQAAAHFQAALRANPDDAETYYWTGMSYQMLADIAVPFGGKYNAKARINLTRAMELAPNRPDYRRELFDFLLDSAGASRDAWRQAECILRTVSETDPEYAFMRRHLEQARRENASASARLGRLFLAAPQVAYRIAELPQAALSAASQSGPTATIR